LASIASTGALESFVLIEIIFIIHMNE